MITPGVTFSRILVAAPLSGFGVPVLASGPVIFEIQPGEGRKEIRGGYIRHRDVFESSDIAFDELLIQGCDAAGTLRTLYRPSVGRSRSLKESEDLVNWIDLIENIADDGLARLFELKAESSAGFWKIEENN